MEGKSFNVSQNIVIFGPISYHVQRKQVGIKVNKNAPGGPTYLIRGISQFSSSYADTS